VMLMTSLPVQVFAQAIPSYSFEDFYAIGGRTREQTVIPELIRKGYASEPEIFSGDFYKVIEFSGGEDLTKFGSTGVADGGDFFMMATREGRSMVQRDAIPAGIFETCPNMPDWFMEPRELIKLKKDIQIEGRIVRKGTWLDITYLDKLFLETDESIARKYVKIDGTLTERLLSNQPALTQGQLAELIRHDKTGRFFGEVDTYAKFARVQAQQAKGGEEIVTVLADGLTETRNVAKAGDYIITNPGGERYIVPGDKFAKKYEAAMELGEGWYKPTGKPQQFRQLKQDMVITASWGEKQVLRKGSYVNVTDLGDLYGVAEREFDDTYKTIKALYRKNFNGIQRFVSKIEERLYAKYPRYQGVFFKRFLKNDVKYMEKRLEQRAARAAARNSGKKAAGRTALRTFGGVALGIGLYLGITLLTAPSVEAQNIQSRTRSEAIRELQADVANNAEKTNIFEKTRTFVDPNYAAAVITDAISGDGALLEEMGTVEPTIEATGVNEDELIEAIVDEAVAEDEEEVRIPFVNPNTQNNPISNFGSFQYQHN